MVPVLHILFLALTLLLPFIEMLDVAFLQFLKKPYRCVERFLHVPFSFRASM